MEIVKKQIAYNTTAKKRTKDNIKYIVIHDTGNTAKGADAQRHFTFFNSGNRKSSADFFVDDNGVIQVNDYFKQYTWHCGDGLGKYAITNANSIGVELCINADGDYDRAFNNMVELVQGLMQQLEIDENHVVRHYDASRKNCPQSMNGGNWGKWYEFKERLEEDMAKVAELEERIAKLENKMIYHYIDDNMPSWARATVQKLMDRDILRGDTEGKLGLTDEMLRMLVVLDRGGVFS